MRLREVMQQENRRPGPANAYEVVGAVDGDAPARRFVEAAQVAVDDAGQLVAPGDAAAQTERIFEIIRPGGRGDRGSPIRMPAATRPAVMDVAI
jgi:hypothetical protein